MNKFFSVLPFREGAGLFIIRIIAGFFLIYHGWEIFSSYKMNEYLQWDQFKTGSNSKWLVYGGKAAELLGGVLLTLGYLTRIAVIILAGTMSYIAFFIGHGKIWYEDQHPFLFVLLVAVFFFTGPGKFSLDDVLQNKKMKNV